MKRFFFGLLVFALLGGSGGPAFTAPSMDAKTFKARQKAAVSRLDVLRARLDQAGGQDLSWAVVLSVRSKDALAVSSTVLAYQEYASKRSLGILMGAAIENASNPVAMQKVRDAEFKKLLGAAPQEQFGVEQTFNALDELLDMNEPALAGVVGVAKRLDPRLRAGAEARKALQEAAQVKAPARKK